MAMNLYSERGARFASEVLTVLFMALVVGSATAFKIPFLLFPELAALTSDVLHRPSGKWAKDPWKLVLTPSITAALGAAISAYLPYGVVAILLSMLLALLVIRVLKSAVSPAISACVLPIVLGVHSWTYPLCIVGTLASLALLLLLWKKSALANALLAPNKTDDKVVEILESPPRTRAWLLSLTLFVASIGLVAQYSHLRFILFPPLVVMAYEMLGHTNTCPWAKPPYTFPIICALAALCGVVTVKLLGINSLSSALVVTATLVMLRVGRLRLPPALAIGLIPMILPTPRIDYSYSVGIGTIALTLWFLANIKVLQITAERSKLPHVPSL